MLLSNQDGHYLWLDPWVISTAFGEWVQTPGCLLEDFLYIADIKKENLTIVISHGHDDHCDEFIIKSPIFSKCNIMIPKLETSGFLKRVKGLSKGNVIEVDHHDIHYHF